MKVLVVLWLINFAPPVLAHLLEEKWDTPLDRGRAFRDGRPIFGPHKTERGIVSAIVIGCVAGQLVGFPLWIGFLAGALSMAGDLLSSFIKRRKALTSGAVVPGLDQLFEGLLPLLVLGPYFSLGVWQISLLVVVFSLGAYAGSRFLKEVLLAKPFEGYNRPIRSRVRWRELRACQITSHPLHHFLNFEDAIYYHLFMKGLFRALGIYNRGMSNALRIQPCYLSFHFHDLPPSFEGYTILFISDLHLDGLEGLTERLLVLLRTMPADVCIIGGDLRMETHGPFTAVLSELHRLIPEIRAKDGIYGVLGNHDCMEIVEPLEKIGMNFLINDAVAVERNSDRIWIVGVDDPHYYQCHDLEQAFKQVPRGEFSILAAHSNEIYREASQYGARLYLCGHTHGGQIRIPPFGAVFTHSKAPRHLCEGSWQHQEMLGYTSCGVGVSGVPVRFFSHGEVALITLSGNTQPSELVPEDLPLPQPLPPGEGS